MSERKILSEVFPAHADLQPILSRIREKFDLPDFGSFDKNLTSILLIEGDIPWDEIQEEIKSELEADTESIQIVGRKNKKNI